MLRVNVSNLNQNPKYSSRVERGMPGNDWDVEQFDAPFECYTVHVSGCGKLNEVASVDNIADRFLEGGGRIVREKMTIAGVGSIISCEDSIGQVFSFIEQEPSDLRYR